MTEHRNIPMSSPDITPDDIEAVNQVLQTTSLSIGPCVVRRAIHGLIQVVFGVQ
jgi:hypothetical protein